MDKSEVDPLDAFMEGIQQTIRTESSTVRNAEEREEFEEEEDPIESFVKFRSAKKQRQEEEDPTAGADEEGEERGFHDSDEEDAEDEEGLKRRKEVPPLPAVDHSLVQYEDFERDFLSGSSWETGEIGKMSETDVAAFRSKSGIRVTGADPVRPMTSFEQLDGAGRAWVAIRRVVVEREGFIEPLPIQSQAIPAILSGRDVIGIAKTGSGKTLAYIAPMMVHVLDQPELRKGDGPIAVVIAPTRELVHQIFTEAKKFAVGQVQVVEILGGVSKFGQFKDLRALCEVIVATPGRLIDLIKMKGTNMRRCTFLVLDEADRMFDLGFEAQMRSIVGQVRPDRQTLMFSATMRNREERLARDILTDPLRITVGTVGEANTDVRQIVQVLDSDDQKMPWLLSRIGQLCEGGSVLIFVSQKARAEEVASKLTEAKFHSAAIHGDKDQAERQRVMFAFKHENLRILVATDVASRGLDIRAVKTVVNLDSAKNIDLHVHRIGRTGRAGAQDGVAFSLVTKKEVQFACELVRSLEQASQVVPPDLLAVAMQNPRFRQQRERRGPRRFSPPTVPIAAAAPAAGSATTPFRREGRGRGRGIGFDSEGPRHPRHGFGDGKPPDLMSSFTRASATSAEAGGSWGATFVPKPDQQSSAAPAPHGRDSRDRDRHHHGSHRSRSRSRSPRREKKEPPQKTVSIEEGRAMALAWAAKYCPPTSGGGSS